MKIHKLYIQNINSLEGEHHIDFDAAPLVDTGIFAIIGPTGSGKSTLLDAITLALYGRIPRSGRKIINKTAIQEEGFILTDRAEGCYTAVDYEVEGKFYRSKWSISRNRKGDLKDHHMELADLPEGKPIVDKRSQVPDKNEDLMGLNYDQFVKSILLAQGDFTRFLRAKPAERGEILESITGTEIYRRIGRMAYEKMRGEEAALRKLEERTGAIELLTQEQLKEQQGKLKSLQAEAENLNKQTEVYRDLKQVKSELQQNRQDAGKYHTELQDNAGKLEAMKEDVARLKQHKQLYGLKAEFAQLRQDMKRQNTLAQKEQETHQRISAKKEEDQNAEAHLQKQRAEQQKASTRWQDQKPLWKEVTALDQDIATKQNLHKEKQKQRKDTGQEQQRIAENGKQKNALLADKEQWVAKREEWLKEHAVLLEELPGELSLIADRLQQMERKTKEVDELTDKLKEEGLQEVFGQQISWSKRLKLLGEKRRPIAGKLQELRQKLPEHAGDADGLQKSLQRLQNMRNDAGNLSHWQERLLRAEKNKHEAREKRNKVAEKLEGEEARKPQFDHELEIAGKRLQELQTRLEREQMEAKYENDRLKLEEGQPCFLCGATHHPFVKEYRKAAPENTKKLIDEKEQEKQKLEKELTALLQTLERLKTERTSWDDRLQEIDTEIENNRKQFDNICQNWGWEMDVQDAQALETHKKALDKELEQVQQSLEWLSEESRLKEALSQMDEMYERIGTLSELEQSLEGYWQKYTHYIQKAQEKERISAYRALEVSLERFRKEERDVQEQKQVMEKMRVESANLQKQEKELAERLKIRKAEEEAARNELEELQGKRYDLFGKRNPEEEKEKLQKQLEDWQKAVADTEKQLVEISSAIQQAREYLQQLQEEHKEVEERLNAGKADLQQRVSAHGYTDIWQAEAAILPADEAERIEQQKNSLDDRRKALEQKLKDLKQRRAELEEKDDPGQSLEAVTAGLDEMQSKLTEVNQALGSIKQQLEHDAEQRQKHAQLEEELKKQKREYQRWEDLAKYIGDKTGKRFATFAQHLTMQQLLGFANVHLRRFNERYRLAKLQGQTDHNKDDLVIVDTFMGDSQRSISTLSGGESFLVSLALALGLADLAGGTTKLSSLFIDEGFGSLDQESLDTALTTLEKLQHETDRTIGIISHVAALKERIATRIELERTSAGYSSLHITAS